ncbi:MAG: AAA family ATPase [Saprospiraceae bacterium]|nr:AAA family ATPase [Saprospiraceae bacterium]
MIVIGITGTLGAGKGTIVEYLINEKQFKHYSVRAFLIEEIEKRGMPVNRDSMVIVANDLRAKNSPSFVTDQLYFKAKETGENCVIESIRTPGEITSLRGKDNFYLLAIDAKAENRFERIKLRKSETDMISFETFIENEKREMTSSDPNKQNLQKCIEMADFVLSNNGDIEELYKELEIILKEIDE